MFTEKPSNCVPLLDSGNICLEKELAILAVFLDHVKSETRGQLLHVGVFAVRIFVVH